MFFYGCHVQPADITERRSTYTYTRPTQCFYIVIQPIYIICSSLLETVIYLQSLALSMSYNYQQLIIRAKISLQPKHTTGITLAGGSALDGALLPLFVGMRRLDGGRSIPGRHADIGTGKSVGELGLGEGRHLARARVRKPSPDNWVGVVGSAV